jgi:hypothetical protein
MFTLAKYLAETTLWFGGAGSGCTGPNCGRPTTGWREQREALKKELQQVRLKLKIRRGQPGYVKKHNRQNLKVIREGLKVQLRYTRRDKLVPGLVRRAGKHAILVQPVWKGNVKKQFVSQEGHKVTILKQPKEYEKSGTTWLGKPSPYRGQFKKDSDDFIQHTMDNPKERNSFWVARQAPDSAVSIELHRNLGELKVKVVERQLGEYNAIAKHKEVTFNNVGVASGFLNKRYGITFKLKQEKL